MSRKRVLLTSLVALAAVTASVVTVAVAQAATTTPASATFATTATWDSGYDGQYTVFAGSTKLTAWKVEFDLPAGSKVTSIWNAVESVSGQHYTVSNAAWNGAVAANGSTSFGFDVTGTGRPTGCKLNGGSCAGTTASASPSVTATATASATASASPSASASASVSPTPSASSTLPGGGSGLYPFAPYVDTDQNQAIAALAAKGSTRYVTLAFMLANGNSCAPAWNGSARDATWVSTLTNGIAALRASGGDVILSFGGANGTELAQACTSVPALTAAYKSVIDTYKLTHLDFDIEGSAVTDKASYDRRSQALASLESSYPSLSVSLTLPVLPTGLTADGIGVLKSAAQYGLKVSVVNVMAMDYGQYAAPDGTKMEAYTEQAAQATHDQIATVYPALADAQLWSMVGVTPMIGVNDACWDAYCEDFTVADAKALVTYAKSKHLGRIAMWSLTRDTPCRNDSGNVVTYTYADPSCSSISQADYAFSTAFAAYTG